MQWIAHNGMKPVVDDWKKVYKVSDRFGVSHADGKRLTSQFNSSAAIGFMPPLRDAQWFIKKMSEHMGLSLWQSLVYTKTLCPKTTDGEPTKVVW